MAGARPCWTLPPGPHPQLGVKMLLQQKSKVHKVCDFSCLIYNKNNDAVKIWMGQGTLYSAHLKMTNCWLEMTKVYFHPKVNSCPKVSHLKWEIGSFCSGSCSRLWRLLTPVDSPPKYNLTDFQSGCKVPNNHWHWITNKLFQIKLNQLGGF